MSRLAKALRKVADALDRGVDPTLAERVKTDLLANLTHEIRTPLNAVIGMTGLLMETSLDAEQCGQVEVIRSSSVALLALIDDILDFAKIDSGHLVLDRHPFELQSCLEASLDLVAAQAAEKKLDLGCTVAEDVPARLVGDSRRLRQILTNLLSNAVKFTERGWVLVRVEAGAMLSEGRGELHFSVEDTGIGIPADHLDRLFRSFSQIDPSATRRHGGTGLGLAISSRLGELLGGKMGVSSKPGRGSVFHFTIVAEIAPPEASWSGTLPAFGRRRVLVIEPGHASRAALAQLLEEWGLRALLLPAATTEHLLALEGEVFDLAIVDAEIPIEGRLAKLLRLGEDPTLPLVSVVSQTDCLQTAPHSPHRLIKPIRPAALRTVLAAALGFGRPSGSSVPAEIPAHPVMPPLRLLLAEDHPVNQQVALQMLKRLGYRADVAVNGLEVLEALRRQSYDVVLLDVRMPELDGLETARRIRRQEGEQPWLIAMTANALQGDRERCLEAGMDDYVSKPVQVRDLRKALLRSRRHELTEPSGPAPLPAASDEALEIDPQTLAELRMLDETGATGFVAELIATFLADADQRLGALRTAAESGEHENVGALAHALKSASRSVGARKLAHVLAELEASARRGEGTLGLVGEVEAAYASVRPGLEAAGRG